MSFKPTDASEVKASKRKQSLRQRLFSSRRRKLSKSGNEVGAREQSSRGGEESFSSTSNISAEDRSSRSADAGQVPTPSPPNSSERAATTPAPKSISSSPARTESQTAQTTVENDKEGDQELASPTDTLTSTQVHSTLSSSRRKENTTSTSDGAMSSATIIKPKAPSTGSRRSFLSRVVYRVVPCVGPSAAMDVDDADSGRSENQSVAMKDFPRPAQLEQDVQKTAEPQAPTDKPASTEPSSSKPPIQESTPTAEDPSASASEDTEVIVPPPPSTHLLPEEETDGVTSGAVQPPGSTVKLHTRDASEDSQGTQHSDDDRGVIEVDDDEERLIRNGGAGIPIGPDGLPQPLLPPLAAHHAGRKCLVLDLDETLVHSSFRAVTQADFIVPVEIEYHWHHFHVLKRPGVDVFLQKMGEIYEVVVYTASLAKYADPVLDKLDIHHAVTHRLFRESCYSHKGNYVKDLSQLGRPIAETIILDNSPASYIFHPNNAVPVSSWFNDPHDTELPDLIPFLADLASVDDVRGILDGSL